MTRSIYRAGRGLARTLALAAIVGGASATPVRAMQELAPDPRTGAVIELTPRDLTASNQKVSAAYEALVSVWDAGFDALGERFAAPALFRYRGGVRTSCGIMHAGNASYCMSDNAIYYDELFLAAQAKDAAQALGTDGDMTAVGIIAHEMGHAVAMQLGHVYRVPYQNEATADCLAGAFAQHAERAGQLERGDVEEAIYGMSRAGDPTPELTGDSRMDRAILTRASLMGHGTQQQRVANFRLGLKGGAAACLSDFRGVSLGA
jgi:predicted metalloprotease